MLPTLDINVTFVRKVTQQTDIIAERRNLTSDANSVKIISQKRIIYKNILKKFTVMKESIVPNVIKLFMKLQKPKSTI